MKNKDYESKLSDIRWKCMQEENSLNQKFVEENAMFSVGDMVTEKWGEGTVSIVIEKISYSKLSSTIPIVKYIGEVLTCDSTPEVSGKLTIYEKDII